MTEHTSHEMHANSLRAYDQEARELGGRNLEVYAHVLASPMPLTDREIAKGLGYPHRSAVQPRISDLVKAGWLVEVGTTYETDSGQRRPVRRVKGLTSAERSERLKPQMELQLV